MELSNRVTRTYLNILLESKRDMLLIPRYPSRETPLVLGSHIKGLHSIDDIEILEPKMVDEGNSTRVLEAINQLTSKSISPTIDNIYETINRPKTRRRRSVFQPQEIIGSPESFTFQSPTDITSSYRIRRRPNVTEKPEWVWNTLMDLMAQGKVENLKNLISNEEEWHVIHSWSKSKSLISPNLFRYSDIAFKFNKLIYSLYAYLLSYEPMAVELGKIEKDFESEGELLDKALEGLEYRGKSFRGKNKLNIVVFSLAPTEDRLTDRSKAFINRVRLVLGNKPLSTSEVIQKTFTPVGSNFDIDADFAGVTRSLIEDKLKELERQLIIEERYSVISGEMEWTPRGKSGVMGIYDKITKRIIWVTPSKAEIKLGI